MDSEKKIFKVFETIKEKIDISPADSVITYLAGREKNGLGVREEIMILNKLYDEGIIDVVNNFSNEAI